MAIENFAHAPALQRSAWQTHLVFPVTGSLGLPVWAVTRKLRSKLFKILAMKVRTVALGARRDVARFMKMQFFTTLIANQRS